MINDDQPAAQPALLTSANPARALSAVWHLTPPDTTPPQLLVDLRFDHHPYEGLCQLVANDGQHLVAVFTQPLDPASANDPANYTITQWNSTGGPGRAVNLPVLAVALSPDRHAVKLTVAELAQNPQSKGLLPTPITLTLGLIKTDDADRPLFFSGEAKLLYAPNAPVPPLATTPVGTRAALALQELGALRQPLAKGRRLAVATELLAQPLYWEPAQTTALLESWLKPIELYLAERAAGKAVVPLPNGSHTTALPLKELTITETPLVELAGRLVLAPPADAPATPAPVGSELDIPILPADMPDERLAALGQQLEQLLYRPGKHEIRVAVSPAKTEGARTLWGVRTEAGKCLGYELTEPRKPVVLVPTPFATPLQSATDVPLYAFQPATGIDFTRPAQHISFEQVDLNEWERLVIESFDQLTTPANEAAIRRLDELAGTKQGNTLRENKLRWAAVLKNRLRPVFAAEAATDSAAAREVFRQRLVAGPLGAMYSTKVLQFATKPTPPLPSDMVPYVLGEVSQVGPPDHSLSLAAVPLALAPAGPLLVFVESPAEDQGADRYKPTYFDLKLTYTGRLRELRPNGGQPAEYVTELRFLTPAGQQWANIPLTSDLALGHIPVLQHDFRTLSLISQEAQPAPDSLLRWTCQLVYRQDAHYPQERLTFRVAFNEAPGAPQPATPQVPAGVFAGLAQFRSVYPDLIPNLLPMLARLDATTDKQTATTGAVALGAFNAMVTRLVAALEAPAPGPDVAQPAPTGKDVYTFELRESTATIDAVEALVIRIGTPAPAGLPTPVVALEGYTTQVHEPAQEAGGTWYCFRDAEGRVLSAADSHALTQRLLTLPDLNVLAHQRVQVQVTATCNAELVPGQPSAPAFVYTTAPSSFPNVTPRPSDPAAEPLDIAALRPAADQTHTRRTLAGHLHELFDHLLPAQMPPALYLQLQCAYTYAIAPGLPPATLPVLLLPSTLLLIPPASPPPAAPDLTRLLDEVAASIAAWYQGARPDSAEGAFVFALSLFSGLGPQPVPLLQLPELVLKTEYVTDFA
ncbi:hypothetical protein [Hymenobacter lucidus]|uniref:Baseplate protein J-like domain-containing protein n=1 Tax=Hymenobacter lucidus TaxID=2880930 RepID=A0ABS8AVM6_9BACT|nr:hypothetical protein [Hymenobacter lucidus]MCB2409991.1 hypothetical protein [Hymenobacter lucidus]